MTYDEYKREFLKQLQDDSTINGVDTEEEFLTRSLDTLVAFEEIVDPYKFGMADKKVRRNRLMRADGYSFDEAERSLTFFITDFEESLSPADLTETRVDELYWRLYYLLDEICNGNMEDYFDDSNEIIRISNSIRNRIINKNLDDPNTILKIKFFILTNRDLSSSLLKKSMVEATTKKKKKRTVKSTRKIKKDEFLGKPLEVNLWYLERFYEMEESNNNDPIIIDIPSDFPPFQGLPYIKGDIGNNLGYDAYITIIPGKLLAQLYLAHGSKILEGNVRAFLGTGGSKSVNSGIKRTIHNDPTKFFTYNNGIATTASNVEIEKNLITRIVDLQVINGGQTTATLAEAILKKTNIELEGIYVPMKLTVIEDRDQEDENGCRFYDKMVQDIARYANSQNKVTTADFFSNDPFHIEMEKLSGKWLATYNNLPVGWYYERSRKKYKQEEVKRKGDELRRFQKKFPKENIVTKEQLAMYLTTIGCKPHIVSKGKNWVMKEFGAEYSERYRKDPASINEVFFKKSIASAIIFRSVDKYLETNKDSPKRPTGFWYKIGGYKVNIVPYTIAKIISTIPEGKSLDWNRIWQMQRLSPAFMHEIEVVTKKTNDFIFNSRGVIVTEYCKRETTWEAYKKDKTYKPSQAFLDELIDASLVYATNQQAKRAQKQSIDLQFVVNLFGLGEAYWMNVLTKGVEAHCLTDGQQELLLNFIKKVKEGTIPSPTKSGNIPSPAMKEISSILEIKEKLEAEGYLR